jgi:hypothetical protein
MRVLTATTFVGAAVALLAAPTGEATPTGGATFVPQPHIGSVKCVSGCASHGRVKGGGLVRLRGSELGATRKVIFLGGDGHADDVAVTVQPASNSRLEVRVPYSAASGPLTAWASDDVQSNPSRSVTIVPAPPPVQTGKLKRASGPADKGAPVVETAVSSGTAFVAGRGVRFSYRLDESTPVKVRIALVRLSDGAVLRKWRHTAPAPDATHSVQWRPSARDGRYAFRLTAAAAETGAVARNAADDDQERDAFDVHGYAFPLHAHHEYGDGFGAARSGHTHQGQDVFARCGAGIYAARGGTVQDNTYQSAAGNYLVIDGAGTGRDFFYAHMREPSPLQVGDRVYTGQRVGSVGDTGDAVGCHLHFEMWTAPGWYEGGHAFDPAPYLRRWDRYS